jgi:hypothetical protein
MLKTIFYVRYSTSSLSATPQISLRRRKREKDDRKHNTLLPHFMTGSKDGRKHNPVEDRKMMCTQGLRDYD